MMLFQAYFFAVHCHTTCPICFAVQLYSKKFKQYCISESYPSSLEFIFLYSNLLSFFAHWFLQSSLKKTQFVSLVTVIARFEFFKVVCCHWGWCWHDSEDLTFLPVLWYTSIFIFLTLGCVLIRISYTNREGNITAPVTVWLRPTTRRGQTGQLLPQNFLIHFEITNTFVSC